MWISKADSGRLPGGGLHGHRAVYPQPTPTWNTASGLELWSLAIQCSDIFPLNTRAGTVATSGYVTRVISLLNDGRRNEAQTSSVGDQSQVIPLDLILHLHSLPLRSALAVALSLQVIPKTAQGAQEHGIQVLYRTRLQSYQGLHNKLIAGRNIGRSPSSHISATLGGPHMDYCHPSQRARGALRTDCYVSLAVPAFSGDGWLISHCGDLGRIEIGGEGHTRPWKVYKGPKVTWPGEPSKALWLLSMAR
ncbi:hypothetical protein B0H13DRAFT_1890580 [Mycena leptocephala]|nr:hypothetical protein B0H13DRAFT_1890580 [Mycena leptocephala]